VAQQTELRLLNTLTNTGIVFLGLLASAVLLAVILDQLHQHLSTTATRG
jgi:hypothetical protein